MTPEELLLAGWSLAAVLRLADPKKTLPPKNILDERTERG